ncbi:MAG: Plug domain-containing protein, partial [Proteobacteria bacterium]|nr:Plug domain-containing protein [Pseudomonadota bacterium]
MNIYRFIIPMLTAGICFLYFSSALADIKADTSDTPLKAQRLELEDVVVTATRTSRASKTVPKNITVISAEDIANSTTVNIVDLLGREANLNIRSTTGNEGKSGIDIRGMGDTYVSNVIVMVDGFRLNSSDMAGPDFLSVPLEEIEKIEIVRGGSAVLYGDGAVGGV